MTSNDQYHDNNNRRKNPNNLSNFLKIKETYKNHKENTD